MNRFLLYIMIPIMLLQSNMTLLISASFYYNQNYIEKYLCIQRNMENNSCHGQCYLMQKLKDQQEKEQQNFKVHFHEASTVDAVEFCFENPQTTILLPHDYPLYQSSLNPKDHIGTLFHPPLV